MYRRFLPWKDVTYTCRHMRYIPTIGEISSVQCPQAGRSWRIRMYFCRLLCVRIEIDQLFRDLIFFTTDLQTVNYYSTIYFHELIYFLIKHKHLCRGNMIYLNKYTFKHIVLLFVLFYQKLTLFKNNYKA